MIASQCGPQYDLVEVALPYLWVARHGSALIDDSKSVTRKQEYSLVENSKF